MYRSFDSQITKKKNPGPKQCHELWTEMGKGMNGGGVILKACFFL